jgi:octaprenyl-diphosphate synthase
LVFGYWLLARALQFAHRRLPERVCREISSVLRGMCQALWLELNSAGLAGWTLNRYLRLADGKTAAWFKFLAAQAALLAGAPPVRCAAAARFGLLFGRFFQIRDDLMDTVADPNGAGKPLLGDARHLRPNLPLILAITNEPVANRDSREKWLADPRRTPGQVAAWLERQGVLTRLPRILAVQRQRMLHALAEALPEGAARQELENRVQAYYAVLGFPLDRVGAVLQIKKKNQKKTTTKASRRRYYDRSKTPGG